VDSLSITGGLLCRAIASWLGLGFCVRVRVSVTGSDSYLSKKFLVVLAFVVRSEDRNVLPGCDRRSLWTALPVIDTIGYTRRKKPGLAGLRFRKFTSDSKTDFLFLFSDCLHCRITCISF